MAESVIENYLEAILRLTKVKTLPEGLRYSSATELLVAEGTVYEPLLWSDAGLEKGEFKVCYRNAGRLVMNRPDRYVYVEGLAVLSVVPLPVEHAWVYDLELERAVEVTWAEVGPEYLGLPITFDFLRGMTLLTGVWGLNWRAMCQTDADPEKYLFQA